MRPPRRPGAPRRAVSRRDFLVQGARLTGGLAVGGSFLAACGGDRGAARQAATDAAETVRISNWPLYIGPTTLADFEKATGIHAEYTEDVNDNNEYFARIEEPLRRGQSIDRDIVVLSDWMVARVMRRGWCQPLDDSRFPNKARLVADLENVSYDPGHRYTMPWMSGMTGLAYNLRRTGRDITSVADLLDPRFRGQVTMLTEMRDTIGLFMLLDGKSPEHATAADVDAACARIERYRRNDQIRAFTGNEYTEDLASGNIAIAMSWSGDAAGLAADNPDLRFAIPKEGGMRFNDCMFVPVTSDRLGAAMAWMNFVYDPEVSARIVEVTLTTSPVQGTGAVLQRLAPELARNPLVNPPDELRARLHDFRALTDDEEQAFGRQFLHAMGL